MVRGKDKRNILIISLLVIVFTMSVGFALLSSNLKVVATGEVSGNWKVKFKSGSLEQKTITDGVKNVTAEIDSNNLELTLTADFEKPGDKLSYQVAIENLGSINAYLKNVDIEGKTDNTDAIKFSYEIKNNTKDTTYTKGSMTGTTKNIETNLINNASLSKMNESIIDYNYLDITLEYLETTTTPVAGESATYTLTLYYEQTEANNNES